MQSEIRVNLQSVGIEVAAMLTSVKRFILGLLSAYFFAIATPASVFAADYVRPTCNVENCSIVVPIYSSSFPLEAKHALENMLDSFCGYKIVWLKSLPEHLSIFDYLVVLADSHADLLDNHQQFKSASSALEGRKNLAFLTSWGDDEGRVFGKKTFVFAINRSNTNCTDVGCFAEQISILFDNFIGQKCISNGISNK